MQKLFNTKDKSVISLFYCNCKNQYQQLQLVILKKRFEPYWRTLLNYRPRGGTGGGGVVTSYIWHSTDVRAE